MLHSVAMARILDGKMLFEYHADEALAPASVTKLVISVAALHKLSGDHTFKTKFHITAPLHRGVVNGDFVVVGGADPTFISEAMWQIAADLRHLGLKVITGDLIIDNSLFDTKLRDTHDRQTAEKNSSHAYDAPVTAF